MLAAVVASSSAAAAAAVESDVGAVELQLGLVHGAERRVADCWLLNTRCQRKARSRCCIKIAVIAIVEGCMKDKSKVCVKLRWRYARDLAGE